VNGTGQPADAALAAELEALERALHAPPVRADRERLAALLDEDFSEIGSSGQCYGRAAALAEIPLERTQVLIESEQFAVRLLADGLARCATAAAITWMAKRNAGCCAVRCGAGTGNGGGCCSTRARRKRGSAGPCLARSANQGWQLPERGRGQKGDGPAG